MRPPRNLGLPWSTPPLRPLRARWRPTSPAGCWSARLRFSPRPGSGEVFDWNLVDGIPLGRRFILAGGLTPENVAGAIEHVRPWGVDVSTGVEREPGHKDPIKVRDFVRNARLAEPAPYEGDLDHPPYDWGDEAGRTG